MSFKPNEREVQDGHKLLYSVLKFLTCTFRMKVRRRIEYLQFIEIDRLTNGEWYKHRESVGDCERRKKSHKGLCA